MLFAFIQGIFMIIYEVIGPPIPWQSPKWSNGRCYNPKSLEKQQTIWQLKPQFNHPQISSAVRMDVIFFMPIPKNTSKVRRRAMLNGTLHHIGKPDRTNLLKFIEDCVQEAGILSNDSIVTEGETKKMYGLIPKTVIKITPLLELNICEFK